MGGGQSKREAQRQQNGSAPLPPTPSNARPPTESSNPLLPQTQSKHEQAFQSTYANAGVATRGKARTSFETADLNQDQVLDLKELKVELEKRSLFFSEEAVADLFKQMDANGDGVVDLEEFVCALKLSDVATQHAKFHQDVSFAGRKGLLGDEEVFSMGLEGRIGTMDVDPLRAMYAEHCLSKDSHVSFVAPNTKIETTPCAEWLFVVGKDGLDTSAWSLVEGAKPTHDGSLVLGRNDTSLDELFATDKAKKSQISKEELIAVRLYTGPMYEVYNRLLRGGPDGKPQPRNGNMYTSSLLLISSAIIKLSAITVPPSGRKVYRGLGGMVLPPDFFDRDEQGFSGGVELGFMSTTTNRAVAVQYSGSGVSDAGIPTVFEIQLGKTSVGADVSWLSQWKHEEEILYNPLTHLQIHGEPRTERGLSIISLVLTVNQRARTLEQVKRSRADGLADFARSQAWDMRHGLVKALPDAGDAFRELADVAERELVAQVRSRDPSWYNTNEKYVIGLEELMRGSEKARVRLVQSVQVAAQEDMRRKGGAKAAEKGFRGGADLVNMLWRESKEKIDKMVELRVQAVDLLVSAGEASQEEICMQKHRLAELHFKALHFTEALALCNEVLAARRKLHGDQHKDVAASLNSMALVLKAQGMYREALASCEESLAIRKQALGEETIEVAESLSVKGEALRLLGQYSEALEQHMESLRLRMKVLGGAAEHLDVAAARNDAGEVLRLLGRYDEALEMHEEALRIRTKLNGEEHVDVGVSHNNIGDVLLLQGKHQDALEQYQEALRIARKNLGDEHPEVSRAINDIGEVLEKLGKYNEALSRYEESMRIRVLAFGTEHAKVAASLSNIGAIFRFQGKYSEALEKHTESLRIRRKVQGPQHIKVGNSLNDIGHIFKHQGKYKEALENHQQALEIIVKNLGKDHEKVGSTLNQIGDVLRLKGKFSEAIDKYQEGLAIFKSRLGDDHVDVSEALNNIGEALMAQGKHQEAQANFEASLRIRTLRLGNNHVKTATSLSNLGRVLQEQGKLDEALEKHEQALSIRLSVLGKRHARVATSLRNIGVVFRDQGKHVEAMARLEESLEVCRSVLGNDHVEVAETLDYMADVHRAQGRLDEALRGCTESLRIRRAALGELHPDCDASLYDLSLVKERLGDVPGALADLRECLQICLAAFGDAHERTAQRREAIARLEGKGGA